MSAVELLLAEVLGRLAKLEVRVESRLPPMLPEAMAAAELSVSPDALSAMIRSGALLAVVVEQRIAVPQSEIPRWVNVGNGGGGGAKRRARSTSPPRRRR
jgi:hypothetical protein